MKKMDVAEKFVECLEKESVSYIFGVPGEENEEFLFALSKSSICFVSCRHEQGAAFMANVWGRLTGRAGVCLSTLGPGATNLVTGIADANLDKAPLVALTAQGGLSRLHHESHQNIDVVNMMKPITKWNSSVRTPQVLPELVRKAFKAAEAAKPGATHIELSEDIAAQSAENVCAPLKPRMVRSPQADDQSVREIINFLKEAEKPLIIAGNGAIRSLASQQLNEFCEAHHIPIVSTFMGKGAVSDRKDHSLMTLGLGLEDYVLAAIEEADLILTVGYDIAEFAPENWNANNKEKIIHIDIEAAEVYRHYDPCVETVGDISGTLARLSQGLKKVYSENWYAKHRKRISEDIESYHLMDQDVFNIPAVISCLRSLMRDEDILISDVGSHKMWIARNYPTYKPNTCIISNGLASMGIALPGALSASLISTKRRVVAAMGDGGFLMNAQELETAVRVKANFVVLVFNDNDYGLIRWKQEISQGKSVYTKLGNPNIKEFAESFGAKAFQPKTVTDLKKNLSDALEIEGVCVVEVPVSTKVNDELVKKLSKFHKDRTS